MQNQAKQIYLEYCHNTEIQPLIQVLDILEGNTDSCKLHRQDSDPEAYLQENDMFALCLVISQNLEHFVELEIQNDVLDANHLSNVASAITSNSHLERLSLVNDSIDDHGVQNLSGALVENNPLLELNLSQNMIKDVGADALSYILYSENCRLEKLNLSRNMIEMDFIGPILEGKTTLTELDLSYNNYSAESIEQLLRGAANNNTLITLNLEGMKGATNLNAIALVDLIKRNSSLRQIGIDLDLSLLDQNMIVKLEEALLENLTIFSIVSPTLEISLNNPQTANIFKILKSNEWLARNYEKLCNNEPVDCNDIIEEYVKIKLDLLTQKMSEIPEIQEEPLEEEANSSIQDLPVNDEPVHLPPKNTQVYDSRKSSKGLLVGPSELTSMFISKSDNTGNLESTERNRHQEKQPESEYQREHIEDRLAFMHEQIERNLSAQFSKLFEDKVTNYIGGISNQISHVLDRLENVENKVNSLEKRINPLGFATVETNQERSTGNFAGLEGRLASLEAHIGVIDKEMKSLEVFREPDYMTRITDEKGETAELRRTVDTQERLRTMEFDPVWRTDMENIYTERAKFERQAQDNFGDIFRKLEDLEGMMDQVIQDQLKDQEVITKQLGSSIIKEKDELEKIVSSRVDNLLSDKIDQLEGTFKSGMVNLRNAVYDTQNRVKDIEHCIVENTELDFRGWKKKIVTNSNQQQLTQSAGLKPQNAGAASFNNSKATSVVSKSNKSSILEKSTNTKASTKTNPMKAHFAKSQGPTTSQATKATNNPKDSKAILVQEEPEEINQQQSFAFSHAGYSRPERERDDPLSMNELQASMGYKNVGRLNIPERDEERQHRKVDLRENAMNSAMSNLPASMRRVKEEIKKKIEDYRAAISPYKRDKENTSLGLSTSAHKLFTESRLDSTISDNYKPRKSLKAEPVGRNIQPSDELVSMLKTRGFAFSNSNA